MNEEIEQFNNTKNMMYKKYGIIDTIFFNIYSKVKGDLSKIEKYFLQNRNVIDPFNTCNKRIKRRNKNNEYQNIS